MHGSGGRRGIQVVKFGAAPRDPQRSGLVVRWQRRMNNNPYAPPNVCSHHEQGDRPIPLLGILVSGGFVAFSLAVIGVLVGYWVSRGEVHPDDRISAIMFFAIAGSLIGLGCGYISVRVLLDRASLVYVPSGLGLLALGLFLTRNPNYAEAARLIGVITLIGACISTSVLLFTRKLNESGGMTLSRKGSHNKPINPSVGSGVS